MHKKRESCQCAWTPPFSLLLLPTTRLRSRRPSLPCLPQCPVSAVTAREQLSLCVDERLWVIGTDLVGTSLRPTTPATPATACRSGAACPAHISIPLGYAAVLWLNTKSKRSRICSGSRATAASRLSGTGGQEARFKSVGSPGLRSIHVMSVRGPIPSMPCRFEDHPCRLPLLDFGPRSKERSILLLCHCNTTRRPLYDAQSR